MQAVPSDVAKYLELRLGGLTGDVSLPELSGLIHRRSEGNPLFMIGLVDYFVTRGVVTGGDGQWRTAAPLAELAVGVPESIRQLVETQLEKLTPNDQRLLEVAAILGSSFSCAAIAEVLSSELEEIEGRCGELARCGRLLGEAGVEEWPDGTTAGRYAFLHALYREALYLRVPAPRRVALHRIIGELLVRAFGEEASDIAATVAVHFELGRARERAVHYRAEAARNAIHRSGPTEAIEHLNRGLELLREMPDSASRIELEMKLQSGLFAPLIARQGYASPDVGRAYARARELCSEMPVTITSHLFPVLHGQSVFHLVRSEIGTAYRLAEEAVALAERTSEAGLLSEASVVLGLSQFYKGELGPALRSFEKGLSHYDRAAHGEHAFFYGQDPAVVCESYLALALWLSGLPAPALERSSRALALATESCHPFSLAYAINFASLLRLYQGAGEEAASLARELQILCRKEGFSFYSAHGEALEGAALIQLGRTEAGRRRLLEGLSALRATGARLRRAFYLGFLASAYGALGRIEEGLATVQEALGAVRRGQDWVHQPRLLLIRSRLRGLSS